MVSQTTIYSETTFAGTFTRTTDWVQNNNNVYPPGPLSGNPKIIGRQNTSGIFETTGSPAISTSTFVNIQVSWNMIRGTSSTPALTFQWSNNAGSTWNTVAYTAPGVGSWGMVGPISLPAAASGTVIYVRWTYTSVGGLVDYVGLDDITVSGTPSPSYYWNGSGPIHVPGSWGINTDGSGGGLSDFTSANQNLYLRNASTAVLTANWNITGVNTVLNVGDGTNTNKINLTVPSSFALTLGGGAIMNVSDNSTLTIQNTSFPSETDVTLGANSTVDFGQSSAVTLWSATYGNLILSGSGNRNQSSTTVVKGEFVIGASNNYVMLNSPGDITQLSGKITCNGNITTALSNLTIDGPGSNTIGTLNFNGTNTINDMLLDRTGQTLTLGSNLSFSGILSQTTQIANGNINLNGRALNFNGAVSFPASAANGVFIGSTTSTITIGGSGSITNELVMDQTSNNSRTLNNFIMNRASTTMALGDNLIVNTLNHTNGNIGINGKLLALNNAITFPANISNGALIGSASSSLAIGGSGTITNNLLMSQSNAAARTLSGFTNTRNNSVLSLGNNLIISGNFNPVAGIININGHLLNLSGDLVLGTNQFTRGFRGSLTSTLTIDGAGTSITGSLFMDQSSSANRSLSQLNLNRNTQTLTLGNVLETFGEIIVSDGTLAAAGNLFIRSDATDKGRIGPVGAAGSITGNVRVETFALGGTTGWTNLGPSGISGLTVASWENQIPMTCISCPNDETSAGGYFVSIQGWDETAAASSTAAYLPMSYSSPLTAGKGYWTYLGNNVGTTSNITWTVLGTAVQQTQSLPVTYSGAGNGNGFNLVSNPFASPVSWNSVVLNSPGFNSNMADAIYVYNPDLGPGSAAETSYAFGVQSDPNGIGNDIPMGQGFYVQTFNNYNLQISETDKIRSNAPLLKEAATNNYGTVLRLKLEDATSYDMSAIRFHGNATTAFDNRMDALKLFNAPGYVNGATIKRNTISTRSEGIDYSINSLPNANTADAVIPVLAKVRVTGQYTITGSELQNFPNSCVTLKDKLTNTTHDLKSGAYVCTISDTTTAPRFELRICADAAMSINEAKNNASSFVTISNDANGVYVEFDYDNSVKSTISITNILGQKIVESKSVNLGRDKVYLDIPEKNQLVFVTVTSENGQVTKKIIR